MQLDTLCANHEFYLIQHIQGPEALRKLTIQINSAEV